MNKIILITGATQGIGKTSAILLAKKGHQIIIHGRNQEKLNQVREEIIKASGNKQIETVSADLLSLNDVRKMCEELKARFTHLDVLINNAGAIFEKNREVSKDGYEKTFALNVLSPMLLMLSLKKLLAKSESARIINLSSAMHKRSGKPDFSDFQLEKNFSAMRAYSTSKLYLIWISRYFAKQLKTENFDNITVNITHPGAVATNFGQDADKGFFINLIFKVALNFMDKPEDGAKSSVYLATSADVEGVSGKFFSNKNKEEQPNEKFYSVENEKIVWDYCYNILKTFL